MSHFTLEKIEGNFKGRDILSLDQFDTTSIKKLFTLASKYKKENKHYTKLSDKVITLLFVEPSSRTFSSFAVAAKRLGAKTLEIQNALTTSSMVKGETLEDTIKTLECYSDLIVMRHPEVGAAKRASIAAQIPVMNAGDGVGEHPTQALLDMFTIQEKFGHLDNLTGLMAGDLLNGRTVHSLLRGLSLYKNNTVYLLSPKQLKLKKEDFQYFSSHGIKLIEIEKETQIPKPCHFWYWTRVQKERFEDIKEYESLKTRFTITPELLQKQGSKDMLIMHPLPRVGEIDVRVDADYRAAYFLQMRNGLFMRMALLTLVLS